jgi:hypothetical protein
MSKNIFPCINYKKVDMLVKNNNYNIFYRNYIFLRDHNLLFKYNNDNNNNTNNNNNNIYLFRFYRLLIIMKLIC